MISMDTRGGNFSTVDPIVLTRVTVPATSCLDGAIHAEEEVGVDGSGSDMQVGCHSTTSLSLLTSNLNSHPATSRNTRT